MRDAHAPLKPVSRLDCPKSAGDLKLANAASDGATCDYASADGAQVQLRLVKLSGPPPSALDPIEAELKALIPPSPPKPPSPPAAPGAPGDKDQNVDINLPGISIHAGDKQANVKVGGVTVDADDDHDRSTVRVGPGPGHGGGVTVDANDGGAIIRAEKMGPDVRSTFIVATDNPGPEGWRVVGYEARGPKSGPLVVAVVKSKSEDRDHLFDDAKRLVRDTAGG
ncbi:MAG: hypothetical protein WDM92_01690 [Caulobacteraceae bacterium]